MSATLPKLVTPAEFARRKAARRTELLDQRIGRANAFMEGRRQLSRARRAHERSVLVLVLGCMWMVVIVGAVAMERALDSRGQQYAALADDLRPITRSTR